MLKGYVPGGFEGSSSVPDNALKAARYRLAGDPEKRVQWMPNVIDHLNKAGHVAELLTCNAETMKARLVHIAKLRHERRSRELGDAAPAFNESDWVFPTLDPAKTYVVGFNFIPKHMKEVYDEHFAQEGFEVIFADAAHLRRGPGHGYKGGVCCNRLPCSSPCATGANHPLSHPLMRHAHARLARLAGTIFVITTVTANRNIVALGHSFRFDTENQGAWEDMFVFAKKHYPTLDSPTGVTISDSDKGIANAHRKVLPSRGKFRCYEHKKQNILQHTNLTTRVRGEALRAYRLCLEAKTDSDFDAAWACMPDDARSHFPEGLWPEFFPIKCPQKLHGWFTSSAAESENNTLATARSQDPFNALLTIVEQFAERVAKQQTLAIEHAARRDLVMPGVPPAVVKLLKPVMQLADKMSTTRTEKVDGATHIYNVGRLSQASEVHARSRGARAMTRSARGRWQKAPVARARARARAY